MAASTARAITLAHGEAMRREEKDGRAKGLPEKAGAAVVVAETGGSMVPVAKLAPAV